MDRTDDARCADVLDFRVLRSVHDRARTGVSNADGESRFGWFRDGIVSRGCLRYSNVERVWDVRGPPHGWIVAAIDRLLASPNCTDVGIVDDEQAD